MEVDFSRFDYEQVFHILEEWLIDNQIKVTNFDSHYGEIDIQIGDADGIILIYHPGEPKPESVTQPNCWFIVASVDEFGITDKFGMALENPEFFQKLKTYFKRKVYE